MQHALRLEPRHSGLAITIAVHAALGAALLIGFDIVTGMPKPRPPLVTKAIPDTPKPVKSPETPPIRDERVITSVEMPDFVIETPPTSPEWTVDRSEPPVDPGHGTAVETRPADPPPATGPTSGAKFDQRYAADFQPPYPPAAVRMQETGVVIVHVVIGTDGRVTAATVARSSGVPRLDAAALAQALAKWRFVPALKDGVVVESARDISVTFRLT